MEQEAVIMQDLEGTVDAMPRLSDIRPKEPMKVFMQISDIFMNVFFQQTLLRTNKDETDLNLFVGFLEHKWQDQAFGRIPGQQ